MKSAQPRSKKASPSRKASAPKSPVRIAIVGTGGMANSHASEFQSIRGCKLVAACDVRPETLGDFADRHSIPNRFSAFDDLLSWNEFDAVAIVTPDSFHAPLSIASLRAGKHVLCEKPLALDYPEAKKMLAAARKAGTVHMVQFSYRACSALDGVKNLIASGALGDLRHVEASYQQSWLVSKAWGEWRKNHAWLWRLSTGHGSKGVLGDIGVHILDFATYPAGPLRKLYCNLKTFPKAKGNRIGEYQLDANDSAMINVEFANGALGTIHTSRWISGYNNRLFLSISGTKGTAKIDTDFSSSVYRICSGKTLDSATFRDIPAKPVKSNFRRFIDAIRTGSPADPDFARGAEIQKLLDACFRSAEIDRPVLVR